MHAGYRSTSTLNFSYPFLKRYNGEMQSSCWVGSHDHLNQEKRIKWNENNLHVILIDSKYYMFNFG